MCELVDEQVLELLNSTPNTEELFEGCSEFDENELKTVQINPELLKLIQKKAKERNSRSMTLSSDESDAYISIENLKYNISKEHDIYMRTVGPDVLEKSLKKVDKFLQDNDPLGAHKVLVDLINERNTIYGNRFPRHEKLSLEAAIRKAHKE